MTPIYLANRLQEVLLSGHWVANTNYQEQLSNISWLQAIQSVGNGNSIAQLTFHLTYYLKGMLPVFYGEPLTIKDKFSFDASPLSNQADWDALVNEFLSSSKQIIEVITFMDANQLQEPFFDAKYGSFLRNIDGLIEHAYYHLGQIVWIKKQLFHNFEND